MNRRTSVYNSNIRKGIKVRITEGPLKGTEGRILQKKNKKEVVILTKKEMKPYESRIERSIKLPKWDVTISPLTG